MSRPFDATIRAAPLDGPLYAQCVCQRTHQLKKSGAWAICKCGRAIRFVGELQLIENAEEWARTASLTGSQLADAQAAAVRAGKRGA